MKGIALFTVALCVILATGSAALAVVSPVFTYDYLSGDILFDAAGLEINAFTIPVMDPGSNHFEHVLDPTPAVFYWDYFYSNVNENAQFYDTTITAGLGVVTDGPYHIMTVDANLGEADFDQINFGTLNDGSGFVDMSIVPEPASLAVLMTGAVAALLRRRRK